MFTAGFSSCIRLANGIDARHGPHHDAQRPTYKTLPLHAVLVCQGCIAGGIAVGRFPERGNVAKDDLGKHQVGEAAKNSVPHQWVVDARCLHFGNELGP